MNIKKIKEDKSILEKIMLAYWISIPSDSQFVPDTMKITQDHMDYYNVDLIKDSKRYGMAIIHKDEIDKYLEQVKLLKEHEIDIIDRIEREVDNKEIKNK